MGRFLYYNHVMVNHEKRMLKYPFGFSKEQKSLIYGSLLGDACVHKPKNRQYARFQVKHGYAQKEYLQHKFDIMKPWINYETPAISDDKTGFVGLPRVVFYTTSHPLFNEILNEFYVDNIKIVNNEILDKIDAQALAYWFCDDGTYFKKRNSQYTTYARISTESFTVPENEIIKDWFKNKYDIKAGLHSKGNNVYRLNFTSKEASKLIDIITPFVPSCMEYKIKLKSLS